MRYLKIIFLIIIIYSFFPSFAQSKTFHLGLKLEFYGYTLNEVSDYKTYSKKFTLSPLPSFYVIISKDLSESFSLSLKPGVLVGPEYFTGLELGFLLNDKIYKDKLFLSGGINIHFINDTEDGHSFRRTSDIIYFIILGTGYRLTDRLSIDICFHQALNKKFGYTYGSFPGDASGPSEIPNMLKIGFSATL